MTEKDIIFFIGVGMGFLGGYSLGHVRGQIVGMDWMAKLWGIKP